MRLNFSLPRVQNINAYDKACVKRLGWPRYHYAKNSHLDTSELSVGHGARNSDLDTPGLAGQDKDLLFVGDDRES
jgi:hypothetical protein